MTLDRDRIVEHAFELLRQQGLAALSMRRLATDLGVAPGAIYWHVPSKQDLLADVAERIVDGLGASLTRDEPGCEPDGTWGRASERAVEAACALREALLAVRDGADVVSLALALRPDGLRPVRDLALLFGGRLTPRHADWAARTLVHFVLGTVAEEQNRAELARAGHAAAGEQAAADDGDAVRAFRFGVRVIVDGAGRVAT